MEDRINPAAFDLEVAGPEVPASRLGEVVTPGQPTLLVFLRHFG